METETKDYYIARGQEMKQQKTRMGETSCIYFLELSIHERDTRNGNRSFSCQEACVANERRHFKKMGKVKSAKVSKKTASKGSPASSSPSASSHGCVSLIVNLSSLAFFLSSLSSFRTSFVC
jgi:hypothetical protein